MALLGLGLMVPRVTSAQWQTFPRPSFPHRASDAVVFQGELVVCGNFESIHEQPISQVARWDGKRWQGYGAGPGLEDLVLAVHGGQLVAAGRTPPSGGAVRAWDGSAWFTLGVCDGTIDSIHSAGQLLYIGGFITNINGVVADGSAVWDGTAWSDLAMGPGPRVDTLGSWQGNLIASGYHLSTQSNQLLLWDGSTWSALGGLQDFAHSVLEFEGDLVAGFGGNIDSDEESVRRWDGVAWTNMGHGLGSAAGEWSGVIWPSALGKLDGELYAAGGFSNPLVNTGAIAARWTGSTWERLLDFGGFALDGGTPFQVERLVPYESSLVLAGSFHRSGNIGAENVVAWSGTEFARIATDEWGMDGEVKDLTGGPGGVLAVGYFTEGGVVPTGPVALWTGQSWQPLGSTATERLQGRGFEGIYDGHDIIAGGSLTMPDGTPAGSARWDGSTWTALSPSETILTLTEWNGDIIGGSYSCISILNGNTWEPLGVGLPVNPWTQSVVVHNGQLYAATIELSQSFTTAVYRLDGNFWVDISSSAAATGIISALTVHDGKLVAAGSFQGLGLANAADVAVWDGTNWASLVAGLVGQVMAAVSTESGLVVGGSISEIDGLPIEGMALLDSEAGWLPVSGAPSRGIRDMFALWGSVWVGGWFEEVDGKSSDQIAVWHPSSSTVAPAVLESSAALQIAPNPFNPRTVIRFTTSARGIVDLRIYDAAGRAVRRFLLGHRNAGTHDVVWDGLDDDGSEVGSGTYFVRVVHETGTETRKVSLVR